MLPSTVIPVTESSQVGEARRAAVAMADAAGLDETDRGRVAIVVTEAATNLLHHGGGGGGGGDAAEGARQIILRTLGTGDGSAAAGIEMLAVDRGRGIPNVTAAIRDGFSTTGTAGEGLGAIRRQSSAFDLYSHPETGTVLFARVGSAAPRAASAAAPPPARPAAEVGVVSLPKPGETACGDAWAVVTDGAGGGPSRFLVADGLGHGPLAAEASQEVARVLRERGAVPSATPAGVLGDAHGALRSTRGAAAAVVFVTPSGSDPDPESGSLCFAGIGNIMAALVTHGQTRSLASYNGTVGHQMPQFRELGYDFRRPALLVMASDGITSQWRLDRYPGLLNRHPAVIAGVLYRDFSRGRDDVTVLVVRLPASAAAGAGVAE